MADRGIVAPTTRYQRDKPRTCKKNRPLTNLRTGLGLFRFSSMLNRDASNCPVVSSVSPRHTLQLLAGISHCHEGHDPHTMRISVHLKTLAASFGIFHLRRLQSTITDLFPAQLDCCFYVFNIPYSSLEVCFSWRVLTCVGGCNLFQMTFRWSLTAHPRVSSIPHSVVEIREGMLMPFLRIFP